MKTSPWRRALVGLPVAAVLVVGSAPAQAASPQSALKKAVYSYSNAYLGGNGAKAYRLVSKRCKAQVSRSTFIQYSELANQLYGPMKIKTYRAKIRGKNATVWGTYGVPALDDRKGKSWKKEPKGWHWNGC